VISFSLVEDRIVMKQAFRRRRAAGDCDAAPVQASDAKSPRNRGGGAQAKKMTRGERRPPGG